MMIEPSASLSSNKYIHREFKDIVKTDLTVREWITVWASRRANGLDGTGAKQIISRLRRFLYLVGDLPLQCLSLNIMQESINILYDSGCQPTSMAYVFSFIKHSCEDAMLRHYLAFNPCISVRLRKYSSPRRTGLTDDEYSRFCKACETMPYGLFFRVMTDAALRFGEAQALTWRQVNFTKKSLLVDQQITLRENSQGQTSYTLVHYTKYRKTEIVYPGSAFFDLLASEKSNQLQACEKNHIPWDNNAYIFPGNPRSFRIKAHKAFHLIMNIIGCKGLRPHDLRHTGARLKLKQTSNLWAVRDLLRHSKLSTTIGYLYSTPEDMRDGIAKMNEWYQGLLSDQPSSVSGIDNP